MISEGFSMKRVLRTTLLSLAVTAALATAVGAAVPNVLTQQGRLVDKATGKPVVGAKDFTYSIYSTPTGGTALWTETVSLTLDDGYFSTPLGAGKAFPAGLFDGSGPRYLGVQIGTDAELTPRETLNSVPFAITAQNVAGPSVVALRETDSTDSQTIPASYGFIYTCKTPAYTAGVGEKALVFTHASCSVPQNSGMGVRVGLNTGGADSTIGNWHYHAQPVAGTWRIDNSKNGAVALTSGSTYVFSTAITNSETPTSYAGNCYCHTMVLITRGL